MFFFPIISHSSFTVESSREWGLAWEGIDFRPARDPSTADGMQLPMGIETPLLDFSGGAKLVYPSAAVAKAAAARSAEVKEAQQSTTKQQRVTSEQATKHRESSVFEQPRNFDPLFT